ncbi:MAG: carboxylating nicotinate-nucleotide diphosphorylase [Fimbriimonadaceae bacterium]|nr:carboxylating nicotinate-nucleotide diphosphorylase [Fimbriimonadaceae bacterium]
MSYDLRDSLRGWLAEDLGPGDVTTTACVPAATRASGVLVAKAAGVVSGLEPAGLVFELLDTAVDWRPTVVDGAAVAPGAVLAELSGPARALLSGERLALNLLQRLSGVATLTRRFVDAVGARPVAVLDTRKTTPGLRLLEKAAVRHGGGRNHRFALYDGCLIKDNHIIAAGGITAAVQAARAALAHTLIVEIEVESLPQLDEALAAGAQALLLDNMPLDLLRQAAARARGRAWTEASGGVTLESIAAVAATGVDAVSVGALTHSAPALDISLDLQIAR